MLRSWVEQYFSDLVLKFLCADAKKVTTFMAMTTPSISISRSGLEPPSDHGPKRAKGVLRTRDGRSDLIKGDVDESTFVRINHWIRCQV
jgi:hypothetical protein